MDNLNIILEIAVIGITPILAVFGFMLRRAFMKLDQTMSDKEIRILIGDRLSPMQTNQRNLEHEITRIERKLDKILDLLIENRKDAKG